MDKPREWHPSIVDVQMLKVGQLIIAAVPGEFSTMAGRRLRERILRKAKEEGMPENTKVSGSKTYLTSSSILWDEK